MSVSSFIIYHINFITCISSCIFSNRYFVIYLYISFIIYIYLYTFYHVYFLYIFIIYILSYIWYHIYFIIYFLCIFFIILYHLSYIIHNILHIWLVRSHWPTTCQIHALTSCTEFYLKFDFPFLNFSHLTQRTTIIIGKCWSDSFMMSLP